MVHTVGGVWVALLTATPLLPGRRAWPLRRVKGTKHGSTKHACFVAHILRRCVVVRGPVQQDAQVGHQLGRRAVEDLSTCT